MTRCQRLIATLAVSTLVLAALATMRGEAVAQDRTLRVALDVDLKIIDPIWTTAHVTRNHGYLVYDTLFALDQALVPRPQMVETYAVSPDKLIYTFRLRDGLEWHDGAPVRAADCVASIRRWAARDTMGQKLLEFTQTLEAVDDRSFRLVLKEPVGIVIEALAKADSNVPFMMPERVAATEPSAQITDPVGSGPFRMVRDEWVPGSKVVYVRNPRYKPRPEPPSFLAGGKVAKVDRIEWVYIPDTGTAHAALEAGEIDYLHEPPPDLVPRMQASRNIRVEVLDPFGSQGFIRMNHLHPPFNYVKARQAVLWATHQEDYMKAVVGNPKWYRICPALFMCGTPLESDIGSEALMGRDLERARQLLKEAGYDGGKVVVLDPADKPFHHAITLITVQQLRKIGMNVDVHSVALSTLFQRRAMMEPPDKGGWNVFHTDFPAMTVSSPILNPAINARCDRKNWPGWPCNEEIERLRDQYVREADPERRKNIARSLQRQAFDFVTHGIYGQYFKLTAVRANLRGAILSTVPVFWNIEKTP